MWYTAHVAPQRTVPNRVACDHASAYQHHITTTDRPKQHGGKNLRNQYLDSKAERSGLRRDGLNNDRPTKLCLSVEELARELSISRGGAYDLVHSEGFPAVRIGCRIVVPVSSLNQWLEAQAGASQPSA